jgi:hypothetical protein
MSEREPADDAFAVIDRGLAEFLDWFGRTKRVSRLEEMARGLIPPDVGASADGDDFVDAIVSRLAATPVGVSALHVMGMVAVPFVALRARSAVERIVAAGGPNPSALARRCGGLVPVQAWRMTAQEGDGAFLLVCGRAGSTRVQVAFVATMDVGDGPVLTEGSLSDTLPEAEAGSLVDVFEVQGLRSQEVAVTEVARDIVNLAKHNIATDRGPTAELLLVLVALLPHLEVPEWEGLVTDLTLLPLAEIADDEDRWDDDALDEIAGIDPADREALQEWMADFNERPVEERVEMLPNSVSGIPPTPPPEPTGDWAGRDAARRRRNAARDARRKNRRRTR